MPRTTDPAKIIRVDDIPEGVILTDTQHKILSANGAALKFFGYEAKEIVGWPLDKLFPQLPKGLIQALTGAVSHSEVEIKVKTRSGKRAIMDFLVAPVMRRGAVIAVMYIGRNARVRRLLEAEIKKARDYFGSIVENSPYGICVTDEARNIMVTNRAVEDLVGFRREELIGKPVTMFYPADESAAAFDHNALKRGQRLVRQLRFRKRDGSDVPVKVSAIQVHEPDGDASMIIESYSDQSDRMRLDQLKNEFVFVAAHELRNPVAAIRMLADIIFEDKRLTIDPILRGYLAKIQEANERLLHLVDDLLEVSRTEAGRLKISLSPQNMVEHVNALLAELRPTAVSKGVALQYAPAPNLPPVLADTNKLKEILTNLLSNAIKYNVSGGTVVIEHEPQGKVLLTRVHDTGIGISEDDQKKLFQKFWRSEDMAVRAQGGTGLGLFIVKELVERMGGHIWVESSRGHGSKFSFTLPLAP